MRKESLRSACESIVAEVGGTSACVLMDLDTGLPLALQAKPGHISADAMELLAAAGASYFNPSNLPNDPDHDVEEVQTTTDDSYVFMARVPGRANELLILVADRATTNLGLGWASMRQALSEVRDAGLYEDEDVPAADEDEGDSGADQGEMFRVRSQERRRSIWD